MTWALEERAWWIFRLPGSPGVEATAYVPAESEETAREHMRRSSYKDAPVHDWPLIGTRFTSRDRLHARRSAARE